MNWYIWLFLILSVVSLGLVSYTFYRVRALEKRREYLMQGQKEAALEEVLSEIFKNQKILERTLAGMQQRQNITDTHVEISFQKIGVTKYDASGSDGGNFSFSLALLDKTHSGVILTALHSRNYNRTYVKKIHAGIPEIPLTDEEKVALQSALQKH